MFQSLGKRKIFRFLIKSRRKKIFFFFFFLFFIVFSFWKQIVFSSGWKSIVSMNKMNEWMNESRHPSIILRRKWSDTSHWIFTVLYSSNRSHQMSKNDKKEEEKEKRKKMLWNDLFSHYYDDKMFSSSKMIIKFHRFVLKLSNINLISLDLFGFICHWFWLTS